MSEKYLVLKGRIIDGTGKEPISDGVIVINDNKSCRSREKQYNNAWSN